MKIIWVIGLTILATNLVQSVPTNQGLKRLLTEDDEDMFLKKQGEETQEDGLSVAEQGGRELRQECGY